MYQQFHGILRLAAFAGDQAGPLFGDPQIRQR